MAATAPKPATASEIAHGLRTLGETAFETARRRKLVDATSNIGEELMLVVADLAKAQRYRRTASKLKEIEIDKDGKPTGFPIKLADVVLRVLTLANLVGIDLPSAILQKARYNASKCR